MIPPHCFFSIISVAGGGWSEVQTWDWSPFIRSHKHKEQCLNVDHLESYVPTTSDQTQLEGLEVVTLVVKLLAYRGSPVSSVRMAWVLDLVPVNHGVEVEPTFRKLLWPLGILSGRLSTTHQHCQPRTVPLLYSCLLCV